jgi:hypothetical protein
MFKNGRRGSTPLPFRAPTSSLSFCNAPTKQHSKLLSRGKRSYNTTQQPNPTQTHFIHPSSLHRTAHPVTNTPLQQTTPLRALVLVRLLLVFHLLKRVAC